MIINTYFRFDDLKEILGKFSKGKAVVKQTDIMRTFIGM